MTQIPSPIEPVMNEKRMMVEPLLPLLHNNVTYTVSSQYQYRDTGKIIGADYFVEATDVQGAVLWKTNYTSFSFDDTLETDIQEVLPVDLFVSGNELIIKHENFTENDRIYHLTLDDGDQKLISSE